MVIAGFGAWIFGNPGDAAVNSEAAYSQLERRQAARARSVGSRGQGPTFVSVTFSGIFTVGQCCLHLNEV
jgi:hypothetical protein